MIIHSTFSNFSSEQDNSSFKKNSLSNASKNTLATSLNPNLDNKLHLQNIELQEQTLQQIKNIRKAREKHGYIEYSSYFLNKVFNKIFEVLKNEGYQISSLSDIEFDFINKDKFDGDIAIRIPTFLKQFKNKDYINTIIPKITNSLENSELKKDGIIKSIDSIGIYINISLGDNVLFSSLRDVFKKKDQFGENDLHKGEDIVVDYSSPNIAKHLHAGHIRSTIIGETLSNLYTANGYTTHRVNHINDRGGFGYLIEGYNRWASLLEDFRNKNDLLFSIYSIYREGQKSQNKDYFIKLSSEELEKLQKFYGPFKDYEGFSLNFQDFVKKSLKKFTNLEKGLDEEIQLWKKMVSWSMDDFANFYKLLNIHQDYILGESFYAEYGLSYVMEMYTKGKVVFYTEEHAKRDKEKIFLLFHNNEITQEIHEALQKDIDRDIGAYVVDLGNFERFVVLKEDKSSIYATRDLGALKYRYDTFNPTKIVYEVGQEQEEHFDKLFKSIKKFGIDKIQLSHIYHGFYIDSKTKKKLSSRDGAANVQNLINNAIIYFKNKYSGTTSIPTDEINDIAHKLAIGSIIFNDLKQDKKFPVSINSNTLDACKDFEKSGGAYILYTIARANSIIKRTQPLDKVPIKIPQILSLSVLEKKIIIEINRYPLIVKQSQILENPSFLTDWLTNICRLYNSYYTTTKVILKNGELNEIAFFITKTFKQVAKNATRLCNIDVPERI